MRCLGVQSVSKTSLVIFKSHVRCLGVAWMSALAGHWTCHHHLIKDAPLCANPISPQLYAVALLVEPEKAARELGIRQRCVGVRHGC